MGEAVFHDQVGTSEIDFPMWDGERVLAHLVTDSYRTLTGADIGFEHFPFIYANLPAGEFRTADAYNVLAPIYDPESESTWKVQTFEMKGIHLFAWLNLLFAPKSGVMGEEVAVSMSGLELTYRPAFFPAWPVFSEIFSVLSLVSPFAFRSIVSEVLVNGEPLYPSQNYRIAAGTGVVRVIDALNNLGKNIFQIKNRQSTEVEHWRALADHIRIHSPLTLETVQPNKRLHTKHSDLGISSRDIFVENATISSDPTGDFLIADVRARIRNYGIDPSPARDARRPTTAPQARLFGNRNGSDTGMSPDPVLIGPSRRISTLAKGEASDLVWKSVKIPGSRGIYPVSVELTDLGPEFNHRNDEAIHWFRPGLAPIR